MAAEPGGSFRSAVPMDAIAAVALMQGTEQSMRAETDFVDGSTVRKVSGDGQSATAGSTPPEPLRVAIAVQDARAHSRRQVASRSSTGMPDWTRPVGGNRMRGRQVSAVVSFGPSPGNILVTGKLAEGHIHRVRYCFDAPEHGFFPAGENGRRRVLRGRDWSSSPPNAE